MPKQGPFGTCVGFPCCQCPIQDDKVPDLDSNIELDDKLQDPDLRDPVGAEGKECPLLMQVSSSSADNMVSRWVCCLFKMTIRPSESF